MCGLAVLGGIDSHVRLLQAGFLGWKPFSRTSCWLAAAALRAAARSVFAVLCVPATYIHHKLFPVSRASNMPTCQSTACIALAAVITLIAGVSDAFVAPSLSSKIDARGRSNTRAGRSSSCLSMGADGGTTRGEQRGDVVLARQRQQ